MPMSYSSVSGLHHQVFPGASLAGQSGLRSVKHRRCSGRRARCLYSGLSCRDYVPQTVSKAVRSNPLSPAHVSSVVVAAQPDTRLLLLFCSPNRVVGLRRREDDTRCNHCIFTCCRHNVACLDCLGIGAPKFICANCLCV